MSKVRRPWSPLRVSTRYLRVPAQDWLRIKRFEKTEFRLPPKGAGRMIEWHAIKYPTPVVLYSTRDDKRYNTLLVVLEEMVVEPLGAISPESLEREGYADLANFRRYWTTRTAERFRPLEKVYVFRIRPFGDGDSERLGAQIIEHLYGDFLNGNHGRDL